MGIKVEGVSSQQAVETIRASVADRTVEIEVETLNHATTRISASAQRGAFVFDGATAREIVAQTELAMTELTQQRKARAPGKTSSALADSSSGPTAIRR
jgi:nicotinate-nucleotide pyrophosphorylase